MIFVAIALLQAAAPVATTTTAEPVAAQQPAADVADAEPSEPKMKRVCHKVPDPRIPTIASAHTVCKEVPVDKGKTARR